MINEEFYIQKFFSTTQGPNDLMAYRQSNKATIQAEDFALTQKLKNWMIYRSLWVF